MLRGLILSLFALAAFSSGTQRAFSQTFTITTDSVIQTSTCAGGLVIVPFTVENAPSPIGITYYAELSNLLGSFNNPDTIGSIPFTLGSFGIIFATFPDDISFGPFFRIRVVADAPKTTGTPSPNTVVITSFPSLAQIDMSPTAPVCEGEPVTLTAGAGFGFEASYEWSNGDTTRSIEVTTPGSYSVTATALLCDNTGPAVEVIMLPIPATPSLSIQPNGDLSLGSGNGLYHWYLDGNEVSNGPATSMTPAATGWYSVTEEALGGCMSYASAPVYYIQTAPIEDFEENYGTPGSFNPNLAVRVYPVPTEEYLHIETYLLAPEKMFFILYDAQGRQMFSSSKDEVDGYYHRMIDLSAYPPGVYSLHLFVHGMLRTYRVMKGH